ncbi:lantibiotic dehydratase [Lewinella sp. W8]|uniref:lantibiotic dehydratase n=1 Tax=Lewinella sp. W8 TaxID=2528208 RepID=UPI0010676066|nr:lantibiotic dehydratase [Lewinella sp. W8]MTB50729.1 hypothetical protein [Lewinella sp. W8]
MIKFFNKYVYRTPMLPVTAFDAASNYSSVDEFLAEALSKDQVQEAIYVASPVFFEEVEKFLVGSLQTEADPKRMSRFRVTALKYLNRMSYRATPFGLCAGVGSGEVVNSDTTTEAIKDYKLRREVKLDTAYMIFLANEFRDQPGILELLRFYPNNSILDIGTKSRYVEYVDSQSGRAYNLSIFSNNEYIQILRDAAAQGKTIGELASLIADEDVTVSEAKGFILQLIDAKILISELEPRVVGTGYQDQLREILEGCQDRAEDTPAATTVERYLNHLNALEAQISGLGDEKNVVRYRNIAATVEAFHGKAYPNIIRLDSEVVTTGTPRVDFQMARHIQRGMKAFAKLCRVPTGNSLAKFKKQFDERYERRMVPLLEALDPELGIGFDNLGSEAFTFTPLVDNLPRAPRMKTSKERDVKWDFNLHSFLLDRILKARAEGSETIELTDKDMERFSYDLENIPPTALAMINVVPNPGEEEPTIVFKGIGKDSATALLARFAHLNDEIEDCLRELADFEAQSVGDNVIAEVNHLANFRVGNITERPKIHQYEIGYITKSNSTEEGLIPVTDLYLGLRGGRLVLVSKSLGKEIVPRLSNAHNYFHNCLPVYKFLATLQEEYHHGYYEFAPNLGPITKMVDYIPRLQYKNFVFRPASWRIPTHEIKKLKNFPFEEFAEKVRAHFDEQGWPRTFNYHDRGTPIFIDLNNQASLFLFSEIIETNLILITEAIGVQAEDYWFEHQGQGYAHELLLPFRNEVFLRHPKRVAPEIVEAVADTPRTVFPSSEWIFFKLYAGANAVEKIVSERLPVFLAELHREGLISSFFFLRLRDPDYHLRIRFRTPDHAAIGEVIRRMNEYFAPELENGFIWKIMVDTYQRELERYGADLMRASEELFAVDSTAVVRLKSLLSAEVNKDEEWLLMMRMMQIYVEVFELDDKQIGEFLKERRETFSHIFNTNKLQKRDLTLRYKNHLPKIAAAVVAEQFPFEQEAAMRQILAVFRKDITEIYQQHFRHLSIQDKMEGLQSYIHMSILRFAASKNKVHEHVMFFMLERFYLQQKQMERQRQKTAVKK